MQILVNTDNQITGDVRTTEVVEQAVSTAVERFAERITRVEVHLNDVNGKKSGPDDHRCMLEARVEGHPPVAVTHQAENLLLALDGATEKLEAALDNLFGKWSAHQGARESRRGEEA